MRNSVLIVDDDPGKISKIRDFLLSQGFASEDIVAASHATDARNQLKLRAFDLLIVDVLLPLRQGDHPQGETSVELLRQIVEGGGFPTPMRIVAVTADREALSKYELEFRQLTTVIVEVSPRSDAWRTTLESAISHICASKDQRDAYDVDVCIQTALRDPELRAAQSAIPLHWSPEELFTRGSVCRRAEHQTSNLRIRVVCAHASQMGMVPASHLASELIRVFKPRIICMSGVCGGMSNDVRIGDVVIASRSWDWQSGKWTGDGEFQMAPEQVSASNRLASLVQGAEHVLKTAYETFEGKKPAYSPRIIVGPMCSGSSVISFAKLKSSLLLQHRKTAAIDMECYGLYYAAVNAADPVPQTICVKSVCDLADATKSPEYQEFCSYASAAVMWDGVVRAFL
jgi:nucleoside phosphorylase